ncbi:site-specific integrase [Burkholderia sp. SRS-46]|nr:site-specific integrase [Burkholderia sp. SRS-46]
MASIRKRGEYQYQAVIRRTGYPTQTRTFETKRDAQTWVTSVESEMDRSEFVDRSVLKRITFGDLLERYGRQETPKKRGADTEMVRIRALKRHPLALRPLSTLDSQDFEKYVEQRLQSCCAETVRRELVVISGVFTKARESWKYPLGNPLAGLEWPKPGHHRNRRLRGDEEVRLMAAARESKAPCLAYCIVLAKETGMRAGEIVKLRRAQIDLEVPAIRLGITKNGHPRTVPMSEEAEAAVRALLELSDGDRLTSFYDSRGLSAAFRRACKRAGITGLCFHDLRHEAASRLAPRMQAPTLTKIMGWVNMQEAMRYYNPTDAELVAAVRQPTRNLCTVA